MSPSRPESPSSAVSSTRLQRLLSPFVQAGYTGMERLPGYITAGERAFEQQAALAGLSGPEAQRAAVEAISGSPGFQESVRQGEEALLSRAAATGGLRGGNIQAALGQFRPAMLEQAINQAYGRFGGLAGTGLGLTENLITRGQNAAGLSAQAGQQTGANIGNLLTQQGVSAMAGGALGQCGNRLLSWQRCRGRLVGLQSWHGRVVVWWGRRRQATDSGRARIVLRRPLSMVQPFHYTIQAPSAFESLVSGLRLGTSLQQIQLQREQQMAEMQQAQQQAEAERQRQMSHARVLSQGTQQRAAHNG
jgi:hypothetical protein